MTLAHDVRLVRAALLYADHVELMSPAAELLGSVALLGESGPEDLLEFLLALDDDVMSALGASKLPQGWRDAIRVMASADDGSWDAIMALTGRQIPPEVREATQEFQQTVRNSAEQMRDNARELLEGAGKDDLAPALESGLLTVTPVAMRASSATAMAEEFAKKLAGLLTNGSTHLLFDDQAASLANAMIRDGRVSPSPIALSNAERAAVGRGLIARLPAFDMAPTDELLDLRRDLDAPLKRYRRAVAEISERLRVGAFDSELSSEIDLLYIHEVDPALADLRQSMAEHGLVREIARSLTIDVKPLIAGTVGSAVAVSSVSLADMSSLVAAAAASAPVGIAAASATARAAIERHKGRAAAASHQLFYLYEIDRRTRRT